MDFGQDRGKSLSRYWQVLFNTSCLYVPRVNTSCLYVPRVNTTCLYVPRVNTTCLYAPHVMYVKYSQTYVCTCSAR